MKINDKRQAIETAITSLRPFLKDDGGDIEIVDIQEEKVIIRFLGACESCSMKAMTLQLGIEDVIKKAVPEIKTVESI